MSKELRLAAMLPVIHNLNEMTKGWVLSMVSDREALEIAYAFFWRTCRWSIGDIFFGEVFGMPDDLRLYWQGIEVTYDDGEFTADVITKPMWSAEHEHYMARVEDDSPHYITKEEYDYLCHWVELAPQPVLLPSSSSLSLREALFTPRSTQ